MSDFILNKNEIKKLHKYINFLMEYLSQYGTNFIPQIILDSIIALLNHMLNTIKIPKGRRTDPKPKRESTYQLIQKVLVRLDEHDKRFDMIQQDIIGIKQDIVGIKQDIVDIKQDIIKLRKDNNLK